MIWNSVSEIWKFGNPKSFGIAYFRYFYMEKVSCFDPRNSKRTPIASIPLPLTRFSEKNNFRVEHFLKFAP